MGDRAILVCAVLLAATAAVPATALARRRHTIGASLADIAKQGGDAAAQAAVWRHVYLEGRIAARHLRGDARENVRGVIHDLAYLARRHRLADRAYPAFLTLQRNVEWFWDERNDPMPFGSRRRFHGSRLLYEFYPGHGWQLQPLANFGHLNGLLGRRHVRLRRLEGLADELLNIAVMRHGFLAFEYLFPWSGGPPGWVSGMATATGMQAFSTLWKRDGDPRYLQAAQSMAHVFELGPPWGVRIDLPEGPFFLQYSQDPTLLVGNAYAQSILGLDTYATNTGDSAAAALVSDAVEAARKVLPLYDTGAWSLYYRRPDSPGSESDLGYHELFGSFLDEMCQRWQEPFCEEAANFHRYEDEPVELRGLHARAHTRRHELHVTFWISKRSTVTVELLHGTHTVDSYSGLMMRGRHMLFWRLPRHGRYELALSATSPNGVSSQATRTIRIRRRRARHR